MCVNMHFEDANKRKKFSALDVASSRLVNFDFFNINYLGMHKEKNKLQLFSPCLMFLQHFD